MASELPEQAEDYSQVLKQEDIVKWKEALESGKWPTISGQILLLEALINTRKALLDVVAARNKASLMLGNITPSRENGLLELYEAIDQARSVLGDAG